MLIRKKYLIVFICCLLGLGGVLVIKNTKDKKDPSANNSLPAAVEATPAQERTSIEAFGLVKATEVMSVTMDFPARVRELYVQVGQRVTLGEPLMALDVDVYRAEINSTEYELNMARFELRKEETAINELIEEIEQKEERLADNSDFELKKLLSDLRLSKAELADKKQLLSIEAVSRREVEKLEKSVSDLRLALEQTRDDKEEELKRLRTTLELKQTKNTHQNTACPYTALEMLKARITLLEQKLKMMKKQINQSFIREDKIICNINNGVVSEINYDEGDLFIIEKKVISVINLESLVVKANVAEDFIKDINLGAEALITPVADYSREYKGKIIRLSELAVKDNGETVVPVEISIENRDGFLLPNLNVDVKIFIDQ